MPIVYVRTYVCWGEILLTYFLTHHIGFMFVVTQYRQYYPVQVFLYCTDCALCMSRQSSTVQTVLNCTDYVLLYRHCSTVRSALTYVYRHHSCINTILFLYRQYSPVQTGFCRINSVPLYRLCFAIQTMFPHPIIIINY